MRRQHENVSSRQRLGSSKCRTRLRCPISADIPGSVPAQTLADKQPVAPGAGLPKWKQRHPRRRPGRDRHRATPPHRGEAGRKAALITNQALTPSAHYDTACKQAVALKPSPNQPNRATRQGQISAGRGRKQRESAVRSVPDFSLTWGVNGYLTPTELGLHGSRWS